MMKLMLEVSKFSNYLYRRSYQTCKSYQKKDEKNIFPHPFKLKIAEYPKLALACLSFSVNLKYWGKAIMCYWVQLLVSPVLDLFGLTMMRSCIHFQVRCYRTLILPRSSKFMNTTASRYSQLSSWTLMPLKNCISHVATALRHRASVAWVAFS